MDLLITQPCGVDDSYQIYPKERVKIILDKAEKLLKEKNYKIIIKTNDMLLAEKEGKKVTLFKSGRLLLRGNKEENIVKEIANEIYECMQRD